MNESFSESFGSFNEQNEQIDSEKDLFILITLNLEKCCNVFIKNLNFFSTVERKTSWMTLG